jgi:hypothetical protein
MKNPVKSLLILVLAGSTITGFSQRKSTREYVEDIPPGRNILIQPVFKDTPTPKGKVEVDFVIDKKGNVLSAIANGKHTSIRDKAFIGHCEEAVKGAKFSKLKKGPETQHGSLTYTF